MKTKQEQIKAMAEDIKRWFEKDSTLDFEQLAERLVQAGYGNVSEYKDNEFAIVAFCNQTVRDISMKKDAEINQARKETAIEILDMLYDMGVDKGMCEYCRTFDVNGVSLAEQICEKYGVDMWI